MKKYRVEIERWVLLELCVYLACLVYSRFIQNYKIEESAKRVGYHHTTITDYHDYNDYAACTKGSSQFTAFKITPLFIVEFAAKV